MALRPTIGLEVHAELRTRTKMFCTSATDPDELRPNVNICPVCLAHPGTLPVINREAVRHILRLGAAVGGTLADATEFDRKSYFYPDIPKGYQISQYEHPLVTGGELAGVALTRIHLEEDTGRLVHDKESGASLVDFNRAGVPLMELVTEPDLKTGEEVKKFGEELQRILRYVGASDANMEKGEMRVEVNISLRQATQGKRQEKLGTKVEIKNINSFKYAADAVDYEIKRQTEILESRGKITQETRGWNENKGETFSQRSKEEAHDYRYFPEPDLPPLNISREFVEKLRAELPELPTAKEKRFVREYGISADTASVLIADKALAGYFEEVVSELMQHAKETPHSLSAAQSAGEGLPAKSEGKNPVAVAAAFLTGDFLRMLGEASAAAGDTRITPENFAELALYVAEDKISSTAAKKVLEEMFGSGEDPSDIIERLGLWQMSDSVDLEDIARHIIEENPKPAADFKAGRAEALQFLVGQVMKETRGKANPKIVQEVLRKLI